VKLYHVTDAAEADAIGRDGFRDAEGSFGPTSLWLLGVFVSDEPLAVAEGDHVIEVVLPDSTPLEPHLVGQGEGYREWCVPAAVLNGCHRRRLDMAEVDARSADLFEKFLRTRGDPFGQDRESAPQ
jgi:hypothetical protein